MKNSKRILSVTVYREVDTDGGTFKDGEYSDKRESEYTIDRAHALDCPANTGAAWPTKDESCDCIGDEWNRREYRYFNGPVENYLGCTPEEIRTYVRQDYARAEAMNNGEWWYIGIRAEAKYQTAFGAPVQTMQSGGLWGIESDSEKSYFAEVGEEELHTLRGELRALGFSTRAISTAFKDVRHADA